jgi:hypothetical protein
VRRGQTHLSGAAILVLAGLAAACGGGVASQPTTPPATTSPISNELSPSVLPVNSSGPSPESSNAERQAAVDAATQDAAARLSLPSDTSDLHVQQVEARQWPDSSLGCPRQGVMYSQIVTPGYLVIISAAGKQLEYRADSRGRVVFCQEL